MAEALPCGVSEMLLLLGQMRYLRIGCSPVSNHTGVVSVIRRGYLHCKSIDVSERPFGRSSQGSLRLL